MSMAPQSLKEVKRYLVSKTGKAGANFGIRGFVGKKRVWGYHLGKSDIFGPGGYGWRDYSVKRKRDRAGLTEASSAMDIRLNIPTLKDLVVYLRAEAAAGRADLMEILGPDANGQAKRYAKPAWNKALRADDSHKWHVHVSFPRDTEFDDRVAMFEGFFGPRDVVAPDVPDEPAEGETPPVDPDLPEATPPPAEGEMPDPVEEIKTELSEIASSLIGIVNDLDDLA